MPACSEGDAGGASAGAGFTLVEVLVVFAIWPSRAAPRTVLLAPDGALAGLPLAVLPGEAEGSFLVERYTFGYPTSGIDLVRAARSPRPSGRGLLVDGRDDYDSAAAEGAPAAKDAPGAKDAPAAGPEGPAREAPSGGTLVVSRTAPRPGAGGRLAVPAHAATGGEAKAVLERFRARFPDEPTVALEGGGATEAAWKRAAPGRRYLHLATHGFFATGEVRSALEGGRGSARIVVGALGGGAPAGRPDGAPVVGWNPMLLSGVILAGANAGRSGEGEDGILTAEEVSGLPLDGVDLAVLSACETGLGEVRRGEGVMGLARGFALAGARTLVLSLWKVPDRETQELMARFYGELWVERPPSRIEALRRA